MSVETRPPTPAFSELHFPGVSNNFNGYRGTVKHMILVD